MNYPFDSETRPLYELGVRYFNHHPRPELKERIAAASCFDEIVDQERKEAKIQEVENLIRGLIALYPENRIHLELVQEFGDAGANENR